MKPLTKSFGLLDKGTMLGKVFHSLKSRFPCINLTLVKLNFEIEKITIQMEMCPFNKITSVSDSTNCISITTG